MNVFEIKTISPLVNLKFIVQVTLFLPCAYTNQNKAQFPLNIVSILSNAALIIAILDIFK